MENILGSYITFNSIPVEAERFTPETGLVQIYEVIRVINNKFLFLEDHLKRIEASCLKSHLSPPDHEKLISCLHNLLDVNNIENGNVKMVMYIKDESYDTACYFIPYHYPTEEEYLQGVALKSFNYQRPDPTIKRWNEEFRKRVRGFIDEEKIYEAALINSGGIITEGSRSNLFFIDEKKRVVTAPTELILAGITRKYVLELCRKQEIILLEAPVLRDEISGFKACFLSGTSPKILPVRKIDDISFNPHHEIIRKLMASYEKLIKG